MSDKPNRCTTCANVKTDLLEYCSATSRNHTGYISVDYEIISEARRQLAKGSPSCPKWRRKVSRWERFKNWVRYHFVEHS